MKVASISTFLGLMLIVAALLAEAAGLAAGAAASAAEQFRAHDRDGDGRISRAEAERVNAGLHTHFSKFDRDADGALTPEEFRRHAESVDG